LATDLDVRLPSPGSTAGYQVPSGRGALWARSRLGMRVFAGLG
jgi:hypothetical protein